MTYVLSWKRKTRTNVLRLIHTTYENLSENATLDEFKTVFLMNYMNEKDFIAESIEELRKENLIVN